MEKRVLSGLILIFVLTLITGVYSQTSGSNALSQIKSASTGVGFEGDNFGGLKINVQSPASIVSYRDVAGNQYTLSGLAANSILELDSNGNLIRGNFISGKNLDVIFNGNIKTNIPGNSKVMGVDGKSFEIILAKNSKVEKEPFSLYPDKNKGDNFVNFKTDKKSIIKFPEFELQDGIIKHNGKNFFVGAGTSAILSGVSLTNSINDGNSAVFFSEDKIPKDFKEGYTLIDRKNKYVKTIDKDGKISGVSFIADNPVVKVNEQNKLSYKVGAQGQYNIKNQGGLIYSYVRGQFVMTDGQLYLYHQGRGLIGFINRLFGFYYCVPVQMSIFLQDGTAFLLDRYGNPLGIMIGTGKNGLPQMSTIPQPNPSINHANPNPPNPEIPNWQHNPDSSPVPGPSLTDIPIKPQTVNPVAVEPSNKCPFTKEEFIRDLYSTKTGFWLNVVGYGPNLGRALEAVDPGIFQKHFGPGSTTTIDQTIADYKNVIAIMARKFGTTPDAAAALFKKNQPTIYNKYGKYLGFT